MAATVLQNLQQALANYSQLLVLVTTVTASPTQANIDAVVLGAQGLNVLQPKPDYSLDGESYSWASYQSTIMDMITKLKVQIQVESGPFMVRSRARP